MFTEREANPPQKRFSNGLFTGTLSSDGLMTGLGIYQYDTGSVYHGSFADDVFSGLGVYRWYNGKTYCGHYSLGKREGQGTLVYKDGTTFCGLWRDDLREGDGLVVLATGDTFQGRWVGGMRHGKGVLTKKHSDRLFEQVWKRGELQSERVVVLTAAEVTRKKEAVEKGDGDGRTAAGNTYSQCIICFNNRRETILLPCTHFLFCGECTTKFDGSCPVCRSKIHGVIHCKLDSC